MSIYWYIRIYKCVHIRRKTLIKIVIESFAIIEN